MTAIVFARDLADTGRTFGSLLAQSRQPDRVVLVDASVDGLPDTDELVQPLDDAGMEVMRSRINHDQGLRRSIRPIIDRLPTAEGTRDLVWILTSRASAHPDALERLVAGLGDQVALTAPKLLDAADPTRLLGFGLQATRTGRVVLDPRPGTRDQGQFDEAHGRDLLAAPVEGTLLDRDAYRRLDGHDVRFGDLGADLDLGWRAHDSGLRVVGVAGAKVALRSTAADRVIHAWQRRDARRVAVAHRPWAARIPLALWWGLISLVTGLALLVAKSPRLASREFGSVGAVLDPRILRSARGERRQVDPRHLTSLFVTPEAARTRLADEYRGGGRRDGVDARSIETETGPGLLGHPLLYLLLATTAMSGWAARHVTSAMRERLDAGLVGGELLGGRATSGQLFDAWVMAWNGSGWGSNTERSPALVLLAAATWLVERIPGLGDAQSPAGVALAAVVVAGLPVAAWVTYRTTATLTARRWPRAVAALAWVSTAPAAAAVGEGRIGALVAVILLPRIAMGLIRAGGHRGVFSDAVRTAIWSAVLGFFVPVLVLPALGFGLLWLLLGPAGRRARGIALVALPLALAGPWLLTLQAHPRAALGGWGTTETGADPAALTRLAGQVDGGPLVWMWTAAILAVGALALLAPGRRLVAWSAALTAVAGLVWIVASPHAVIGYRPAGDADAGAAVTPWTGVGILVLVGAALVVALNAVDVIPERSRLRSATAVAATLPAWALAVAAVGSAVTVADRSFGDHLETWREPRPLVAVNAAEGPLAGRTLVIAPRAAEGDGAVESIGYRLIGSEPGPLVRDVVATGRPTPAEESLSDAVARLIGEGGSGEEPLGDVLAGQGIGYVVVQGASEAQRRTVDASAGLDRLGTSAGATTWTIRPPMTDGQAPGRLSLIDGETATAVRGVGAHGDTSGGVAAHSAEALVVAESLDWVDHATVAADGVVLEPDLREATPTYRLPSGTSEVSVDVDTGHRMWKVLQGLALLAALYLALPTERRPEDEDEDEDEPGQAGAGGSTPRRTPTDDDPSDQGPGDDAPGDDPADDRTGDDDPPGDDAPAEDRPGAGPPEREGTDAAEADPHRDSEEREVAGPEGDRQSVATDGDGQDTANPTTVTDATETLATETPATETPATDGQDSARRKWRLTPRRGAQPGTKERV